VLSSSRGHKGPHRCRPLARSDSGGTTVTGRRLRSGRRRAGIADHAGRSATDSHQCNGASDGPCDAATNEAVHAHSRSRGNGRRARSGIRSGKTGTAETNRARIPTPGSIAFAPADIEVRHRGARGAGGTDEQSRATGRSRRADRRIGPCRILLGRNLCTEREVGVSAVRSTNER